MLSKKVIYEDSNSVFNPRSAAGDIKSQVIQRAKFARKVPLTDDPQGPYTLGFQKRDEEIPNLNPRDSKMDLLNELARSIHSKRKDLGPHVALSFHAGQIRVAVNRGKSGSTISHEDLISLTHESMQGYNPSKLDANTRKWFEKYHKDGLNIKSLDHENTGIEIPKDQTVHGEQFIARDVINHDQMAVGDLEPGQYRGQNGIKEAPPNAKKVVRIGGVLDDCALCHIDHHGVPMKTGEKTAAGNSRIFRTPRL